MFFLGHLTLVESHLLTEKNLLNASVSNASGRWRLNVGKGRVVLGDRWLVKALRFASNRKKKKEPRSLSRQQPIRISYAHLARWVPDVFTHWSVRGNLIFILFISVLDTPPSTFTFVFAVFHNFWLYFILFFVLPYRNYGFVSFIVLLPSSFFFFKWLLLHFFP